MAEGPMPSDFPPEPPQAPPPGPRGYASGPPPIPGMMPMPSMVNVLPPRRRNVLAIFLGILLALSFMVNAILLVGVIGLAALVGGAGGEEGLIERVLEKSASTDKIAVIRVQGIVNSEMAQRLHTQFDRAARDLNVKAVILRINSPGGGLTASDTIYHDIKTMLGHKPVVAAMEDVAASGGYYIACAADEIVAQRTTITGSIGVVAQFFFVNGLLKDKLGVVPVTLTKGKKKDWPNIFTGVNITDEQRQYLDESLMEPGYQQFVSIVHEARKMSTETVLGLATGEIYLGTKAKDLGLIDDVGYFNDAVAKAKKHAGIQAACVVEYTPPFSLSSLLGVESKASVIADLNPETLAGMASPKIMYLWVGN
jgi:protease IV